MIFFKSKSGEVFCYSEEDVKNGYGAGMEKMSKEESDAYIRPVLTPEQEQKIKNASARAYLSSTDWYVIRSQETGEKIPQEIAEARAKARSEVIE